MNVNKLMDKSKHWGKFTESLSGVNIEISGHSLFENFSVDLQRDELRERLEAGGHLFTPEKIDINDNPVSLLFELLLDVFLTYLPERAGSLENLDNAYRSDVLFPGQLLRTTLDHSWSELQNLSRQTSVEIDLLQFFSLYLARPFRQKAAEQYMSEVDLNLWKKGACPICGHWPVLGRIFSSDGNRRLWCFCCSTEWKFPRIGCFFCLNQSQDQLGYITVETFDLYRIYFCDKCKRYLKFIESLDQAGQDKFNYDLAHFEAVQLDQTILSEGYVTEPVWLAPTIMLQTQGDSDG